MRANVENEAFFLKLVEDGLLVIQPDGSIFNGKTLKVYGPGKSGYIQIGVKVRRKTKHILAHRLVYLAKVGPLGPDENVFHADGVRSNNLPSNLIKGDDSDTTKHAYALSEGRYQANMSRAMKRRGEALLSWNAKLTPEQAEEIQARVAKGEKKKHLAREFGIHHKAIGQIVSGAHYRRGARPSVSLISGIGK